MKHAVIFLLLLVFSVSLAKQSYADTQVNIHTMVTTSTNATSTSNSHTTIHMETNGKVQDYDSDRPENVHMESEGGNNIVDIQNNSTTTIVISQFPKLQISHTKNKPTSSARIFRDKQAVQQQIDKNKEKLKAQKKSPETFSQKIQNFLRNLFPVQVFFK